MPRSVIQEVEQEFGQPFWDVVRGFAEDGHSIQSTTELLGYASGTPFRRLLARHKPNIQFAGPQESVFQREARQARRGKCTPRQAEATKIASAANPVYRWVTLDGIRDTIAGHARRKGIPTRTVRHRLVRRPGDLAYAFSPSKQYIRPDQPSHVWSRAA